MARLSDLLRHSHVAPDSAGAVEPPPAQIDPDVCQECGGVGFVRREVPMTDPAFGKAIQCRCVGTESLQGRQDRLQKYSNLGPLTRLTFNNLIARGRSADPRDQARFQRCVEDAESFAKDPQGWLVLIGSSGCGKTHIAAAIANRCLELGTPALFVVMPDLLDHLRAAYRPDADVTYDELFEQVRNAPVLILDDLGTQSATPWAEEKLFQIINERFNERLPTVITTNTPLKKLDTRLRSRLGDPSLSQPHADVIARVHELEARRALEDWEPNMLDLPGMRERTFERFDLVATHLTNAQQRDLENAYQQALRFANDPEKWLILIGDTGTGKTHLAAAIGNYRRLKGEAPYFTKVADLLDFLRHSMDGEPGLTYYEAFEEIKTTRLLILDDLEVGSGSAWTRDKLFQLLDYRYEARLATVITTTSTLQNLQLEPSWARLVSRLAGDPNFCSVVPVRVPNQPREPSPNAAPRKKPAARRKTG